jgi:hypothetical protein
MPIRADSYQEALGLAHAAGTDAAHRRRRRQGRPTWNEEDRDHACEIHERVMTALGYPYPVVRAPPED